MMRWVWQILGDLEPLIDAHGYAGFVCMLYSVSTLYLYVVHETDSTTHGIGSQDCDTSPI